MNKNFLKTISVIAVGLGISACAVAQASDYTVTIPLTEDEDGLEAYLVDYDTSAKLDSTMIDGAKALFKGSIDSPRFVQLIVDGSRKGMFVLEPGVIVGDVNSRRFSGTPTNEAFIKFGQESGNFIARYRKAASDTSAAAKAEMAKIQNEYVEFNRKAMEENSNNPIGYYLFLQEAYEKTLPQLDSALVKYPAFAQSARVKRLRESLLKKQQTSVGKMMKDFTIVQPDGTKKSLSDYVGRGQYTLVDFWASWCGPCIRETKVIKELYNKYSDKGLKVLGVAVWDEPQNTLTAIEQHQLPWEQIINAGTVPTDIYGISGIPCIILFDPQGKIVSRDKQDAELVADVEAAISAASAAEN